MKELFYSAKEELSTKDNEFEKRFLSIERDLVRNHNFSSVKNELGKIIHDAKIKNLSEVVDRARELMRLCNNKEREFSKKVNSKNSEEQDEYFDSVKKESDLVAKFPSSGRIIHNQLGPIRTLTKPEIEARGSLVFSSKMAGFELGLKLLKRGGVLIPVGLPAFNEGQMQISLHSLIIKGLQIVSSLVGNVEEMRELVNLAAEGKVKTHIGRVANLSEINQVFEELEKGKFVGRAIIDNFEK